MCLNIHLKMCSVCEKREGPRCRLVDCSRIVWTRGPRPGLDNGGLVIGRRYLGGMAEMEDLISEPCDSPLQIVFDGNSLALTHLVDTFVMVKNSSTFMHSIENVTELVFAIKGAGCQFTEWIYCSGN